MNYFPWMLTFISHVLVVWRQLGRFVSLMLKSLLFQLEERSCEFSQSGNVLQIILTVSTSSLLSPWSHVNSWRGRVSVAHRSTASSSTWRNLINLPQSSGSVSQRHSQLHPGKVWCLLIRPITSSLPPTCLCTSPDFLLCCRDKDCSH